VGPGIILLDKAMTSFCKLDSNDVSICSGLTAILNAMFPPAAITYVRRFTVSRLSVDCGVQYNSVAITCMGLQSLCRIAFFPRPEIGLTGCKRYGRSTLETAGLLVFCRRHIFSALARFYVLGTQA